MFPSSFDSGKSHLWDPLELLSSFAMPSILSDEDRETVKRFVPKQTNKIHAVAVARLYIAYPNRSKWTYTGLQGAVVLANDLVGNTYWLKMVDISVCLVASISAVPRDIDVSYMAC